MTVLIHILRNLILKSKVQVQCDDWVVIEIKFLHRNELNHKIPDCFQGEKGDLGDPCFPGRTYQRKKSSKEFIQFQRTWKLRGKSIV